MKDIDKEWFYGIYPYFRILKKLNELVIKLSKYGNPEEQEDYFFEFVTEFMRLIPYSSTLKKDETNDAIVMQYNNEDGKHFVKLNHENGILELEKYIPFLKKDYESLIYNNEVELYQLPKIRNKFQHEPHNIKWVGDYNCRLSTKENDNKRISIGIVFKYKGEIMQMDSSKLIKILIDLNNIFEKIKKQFIDKTKELENDELIENKNYINKIIKFDFNKYSKEYEDTIL